jgi:hypothetical protein
MLEKSGGFAALVDRGRVTQCSLCDKDNPDLENRGYCSACGAVFRERMRRRLTIVKIAAVLGVMLTASGAALALAMDWRWTGLALFALGIVPLAFGLLANRQLAGFLMEALSLRTASDAQRSLRSTHSIAGGLLVYFVMVLIACVPYYLYIERPRQRLARYQARFADKLGEYAALASDDVRPAPDARPYLEGKAVVVEKADSGPRVSEVHMALARSARAETPADVGTVVLIEWKDVFRGEYGDKGSGIHAFRVDGDVRIINLASKTLLAREEFTGVEPPQEAPRGGGPGRGAKPIAKIAGYVSGLEPEPPGPQTPASPQASDELERVSQAPGQKDSSQP